MKKQILYEFTIDRNRKYTIYTDATIDLPKEDEGKPCWVNNNYPILIIEETENYCRYFCQNNASPDKSVTESSLGSGQGEALKSSTNERTAESEVGEK